MRRLSWKNENKDDFPGQSDILGVGLGEVYYRVIFIIEDLCPAENWKNLQQVPFDSAAAKLFENDRDKN